MLAVPLGHSTILFLDLSNSYHVQWGIVESLYAKKDANGSKSCNFPLSFTSACFNIVGVQKETTQRNTLAFTIDSVSQFTATMFNEASATNHTVDVFYQAIGS